MAPRHEHGHGAARAAELEELYRDVALEIRSRTKVDEQGRVKVELPAAIRRLRRQAPMLALEAVGKLAATLRQATGRDVIDIAAMMAIVQFLYQQAEIAQRDDRHGRRVRLRPGLHRVLPARVPVDLPLLLAGRYDRGRERAGERPVAARRQPCRGAALGWGDDQDRAFRGTPEAPSRAGAGGVPLLRDARPIRFLSRTGQTVGHPDDAHRLLERDELVLVFPEGVKGTGKGWSNRYRLRRFGRGGYVQTAIRAGAPIIPVSVVGSEEIYPMIADLGPVADLFGLPYFPVTPTFPLLGPLGMVPLPSKWRIQFHEPIRTDLCAPEDAADQRLVMTLNDHVRDTVQAGILENVKLRRGSSSSSAR